MFLEARCMFLHEDEALSFALSFSAVRGSSKAPCESSRPAFPFCSSPPTKCPPPLGHGQKPGAMVEEFGAESQQHWPLHSSIALMLTSSPQGQGATRSCAFLHSTDPSGQELVQASLFSKVALKMLNLQETVERILLRKIQTVQQEEFRFAELQVHSLPMAHSHAVRSLVCLHTASWCHFFLHFLVLLPCSLLSSYRKFTQKLLPALHIFRFQCYFYSAMKNTLRQIFSNSCAVRLWARTQTTK